MIASAHLWRRLLGLLALIALLVGGWYVSSWRRGTSVRNQASGGTVSIAALTENQSIIEVKSLKPRDVGRLREYWRQQALTRNRPGEFHARVLDQDGHPVAGATVEADLSRVAEDRLRSSDWMAVPVGDEVERVEIKLIADSSGWVHLLGISGLRMRVESVGAPGFLWDTPQFLYYDFDRPNLSEDFRDRSKGVTFYLWRRGTVEPCLIWTRFHAVSDEKLVREICLFHPRAQPGEQGDLILRTPLNDPEQSGDRHYDRWIVLEAGAHAELVETTDVYPYRAAAQGYQREFRWLYRQGEPDSTSWIRRFYVRARSGCVSASLTVKFGLVPMGLEISAIVNPRGSPYLEPDPDLQISDPDTIERLDSSTRQATTGEGR